MRIFIIGLLFIVVSFLAIKLRNIFGLDITDEDWEQMTVKSKKQLMKEKEERKKKKKWWQYKKIGDIKKEEAGKKYYIHFY